MKLAYELFTPAGRAHTPQDSSLMVCFRELWERVVLGQEPTAVDLLQVEHMADWLQEKMLQYHDTPPALQALQPLFEVAREGWELMLAGVYCLADYLEQGQPELLAEARILTEEGEDLLKQLEEGIVASRDEQPLCDGYLD